MTVRFDKPSDSWPSLAVTLSECEFSLCFLQKSFFDQFREETVYALLSIILLDPELNGEIGRREASSSLDLKKAPISKVIPAWGWKVECWIVQMMPSICEIVDVYRSTVNFEPDSRHVALPEISPIGIVNETGKHRSKPPGQE